MDITDVDKQSPVIFVERSAIAGDDNNMSLRSLSCVSKSRCVRCEKQLNPCSVTWCAAQRVLCSCSISYCRQILREHHVGVECFDAGAQSFLLRKRSGAPPTHVSGMLEVLFRHPNSAQYFLASVAELVLDSRTWTVLLNVPELQIEGHKLCLNDDQLWHGPLPGQAGSCWYKASGHIHPAVHFLRSSISAAPANSNIIRTLLQAHMPKWSLSCF